MTFGRNLDRLINSGEGSLQYRHSVCRHLLNQPEYGVRFLDQPFAIERSVERVGQIFYG